MRPFTSFHEHCVADDEKDQLVAVSGNCLEIQNNATFTNLFEEGNPTSQLAATFGANFLHFMSPVEILDYLCVQYELLKPGGQAFILFNNTSCSESQRNFAKDLNYKDLKAYSRNRAEHQNELQYFLKSTMSDFSNELRSRGIRSTGYFKSEWAQQNTGTQNPIHNSLFKELWRHYTKVHTIDPTGFLHMAKDLGFEVIYTCSTLIGSEKIENYPLDNPNGIFSGVVLKKPDGDASQVEMTSFKETEMYHNLKQQLLNEEEILFDFYKNLNFKPEYPYFTAQ